MWSLSLSFRHGNVIIPHVTFRVNVDFRRHGALPSDWPMGTAAAYEMNVTEYHYDFDDYSPVMGSF